MKKVKIFVLGLLVANLSTFAMESENLRYVRIDRSRENVIVAQRSDGIMYRVEYNPITNTYSGQLYTRVQPVPGRIQPSPGFRSLSAEDAENLYKELSRVEKG